MQQPKKEKELSNKEEVYESKKNITSYSLCFSINPNISQHSKKRKAYILQDEITTQH